MRFLSLDDYEPGVIAIGGAPIGIIALGAVPVGVIAIGFGAVGGVAVSCGGSVGLVALSCGLGVGGYAGTVGLSFGLRTSSVGGEIAVLPDGDDPFPRAAPTPKTQHELTSKLVVPVEEIGAKVKDGWAIVAPTRSSEYQPWGVTALGETVTITSQAAATLRTWDGERGPVLAHLTSAAAAPHGEGGGYRDTAPPRYALTIDQIVLPVEPEVVGENLNIFGRQVWWIGKLVVKSVAWLACMSVAVTVLVAKLASLDMTRTASPQWSGTVKGAEGMIFTAGDGAATRSTSCRVWSAMRSDGKSSLSAKVAVSCGSLELYPQRSADCSVTERPVAGNPGYYVYDLSCSDPGEKPSDDHLGRPSLELSTREGRAVVAQTLPQPFRVEIALDPRSTEQPGEPLFLANAPVGGASGARSAGSSQAAPPAAPSAAPSTPSTPSTPSSLR